MKRFLLKAFLGCIYVLTGLGSLETSAQNIFNGEPVQWVGRPNGYSTTPYNSDYRTTIYRKVSTTASNPSDGRGQWTTTINVQSSGGNITPDNMPGGGGSGWLLISGPSGNRFQNKWNFNGVGQAALNAVNNMIRQGGGQDMGLNMGTAGYYTFVMRDAGYNNSEVYIAYTTNAPVTVANGGVTYSGGAPVVAITTSATPSSGENIYVRYRVGTNDFTSGTSLVQASGTGTSWSATLPTQSCNATVYYYIFTSTRTLSELNADSEQNRSLAVLRYDDNFGANRSFTVSQSTAAVLSGGAALCQGQSTNLQVAVTGGLSPYTVVYSDGTSNFTVSNYTSGTNIAVSPSSSKTYTLVSVTGSNGCAGTGLSGSATVTVSPNVTYYADNDGDGFGNPSVSQVTCTGAPANYVTNNLDSNDNLLTYEDIDGDGFGTTTLAPSGAINNTDCDDNDNTKNATFSFYEDVDGDGVGFGSLVSGVCAVDANTPPAGYSLINTDCSPNDGATYQEGTFYTDADGDNYAVNNNTVTLCYGATEPTGYSALNLGVDCDDTIGAINPGAVEVLYNGFDDNCNGVLDEGNQIIANMVNCGTTLSTLSSLIYCVSTPGVNGYRFEVTNTVTNQVQTIDKPAQFFSLTELASYDYATTYSVRVMVRKASNNVWLGYYSSACLYSTPPVISPAGGAGTTQLQNYCGQTLPAISTILSTTSLPGATGYRFRVTDTNTNAVQTITRTLPWFTLTMLSAYNYGATYAIDVAVKTTGNYSDYGASCFVSTPAVPTLTNYCGGAIVPGKGTFIATSSLDRVTAYEFTVDRYNEFFELVSTSVVVKSINRFNFNDITNYTPNTTYSVRVRVFTAGSWSAYGDACEIVSPGTAREGETKAVDSSLFSVVAYPNPYDYQFSIRLESASEAPVTIKVYDMIGKLIETREVNTADIPVQSLGEAYPTGVYNVVITQEDNTRALRMIKR
ncbi:T9SS type A sorting domain-containing protein [Flavobacterium mekongense]|uniref:T9SS type A sorting domain-containing protein n=1 Tax=Flavobacterium mekongense TaxID=3379707 RepID=UPI00399C082F